jgi:hypothetical protein
MSTIPPMGIGLLGNANIVFSSKFRWQFEATFPLASFGPVLVKLTARPTYNPEIDAPNQVGQFTTTFFDFKPEELADLYKLMADFYQFGTDFFSKDDVPLEAIREKCGTIKITMLNHTATPIEKWTFGGCFPLSVNFGYSSSDETTLEVTWKYFSCKLGADDEKLLDQ